MSGARGLVGGCRGAYGMAGDAEATSRPTPVARARVAVAGLAALSVALLPALAVPTWLDSQDIEPLPASVRSAPREDVQGVSEPARSSYSARASLCGMPDKEDYEELGRLLASEPSWTPSEAPFMQSILRSQSHMVADRHPKDLRRRESLQSVVGDIKTAIQRWQTKT